MRSLGYWCFGVFLVAAWPCGAASAQDGPTAPYSVHEWGLLAFSEKSGAEIFTVQSNPTQANPSGMGLGLSGTGAGGGKPVLYFHPAQGFDPSTAIEVAVRLPDGTVREVWPTPGNGAQPQHSDRFVWGSVKVLVGQRCGRELAPSYEHAACTSIQSNPTTEMVLGSATLCEASELGGYLSAVEHCLEVSSGTGDAIKTPVLLYNGYLHKAAPPLVITEREVKNQGAHPVGPLYIKREGVIYALDSLAPGQAAQLKGFKEVPLAELHTVVRAALVARGLTSDEALDFAAAWRRELFEEGALWTAFGVYGAQVADALAPLTLKPAPTSKVRVLGFRQ